MVAAERETLGIIEGVVCKSDVEHGEGLLLAGCATARADNPLVASTLRVEQVGQTLHVKKQGRSVGVARVHVSGLVTKSVNVKGKRRQTITIWPL